MLDLTEHRNTIPTRRLEDVVIGQSQVDQIPHVNQRYDPE